MSAAEAMKTILRGLLSLHSASVWSSREFVVCVVYGKVNGGGSCGIINAFGISKFSEFFNFFVVLSCS